MPVKEVKDTLSDYRRKRNFHRTREPAGIKVKSSATPLFVVQKHDATNLHYDFRLEVGGVLKSWAVPKGPSVDPKDKRMAVPTEDHPLDYARFEGVIPEGEYGAGPVQVWDLGTYRPLRSENGDREILEKELKEGRVSIWLEGDKLKGGFALIRTRRTQGKSGKEQWLLIKMSDSLANPGVDLLKLKPRSVLSGRTIEEIAAGKPAKKAATPKRKQRVEAAQEKPDRETTAKSGQPEWIEPMLATLTAERFSRSNWIYEQKLDGERCLAYRQGRQVRLMSRNRKLLNDTYPEIVEAIRSQPTDDFIADGEIVAFDRGLPSFERLQQRIGVRKPEEALRQDVPVYFYLFDLLSLQGRDLRKEPLLERKNLLRRTLIFDDPLRFTIHLVKEGEAYYEQACMKGWEGVIAKRADSPYQAGRSSDWLKFKCVNEQEFVIGGFTDPQRTRPELGALLIGYYRDGDLLYAGKVGTGFNLEDLHRLKAVLEPLEEKGSPFADYNLPRAGVHWVKPRLVAQIAYSEWTRDGRLRHPRFMGLRRDKDPRQVSREIPRGHRAKRRALEPEEA